MKKLLLAAALTLTVAPIAYAQNPEARSLAGKPLFAPSPVPDQQRLEANLAQAQKDLAAKPNDAEAMIWVGRRYGYLWRYNDAIAMFTKGIAAHPNNAKFYRHRGHRYITIREFAKAQADFEKAAQLVKGQPDEVEPDGAPNPKGIPRTTLQFNIWYHLALARYLQGNYRDAYDAWVECMKVSKNDDSVVATSDWMWMTLMRLGRKDEAARVLEPIKELMDILENTAYHRRLLMYKGLVSPETLLDTNNPDPTQIATQGYGLANYFLVTGDKVRARIVLDTIVGGAGWNAFGFIAAEADLQRMK